jgi:hypothetical protein
MGGWTEAVVPGRSLAGREADGRDGQGSGMRLELGFARRVCGVWMACAYYRCWGREGVVGVARVARVARVAYLVYKRMSIYHICQWRAPLQIPTPCDDVFHSFTVEILQERAKSMGTQISWENR